MTFGKRPFAAVLLAPDNETVLLTHQSISQVDHAESSLARLAYMHYSKAYLWTCTLVSTWEPCAMCTSTIYWAHIGRIVYAGGNDQLYELTGPANKENFTMDWHCRDVLKGCSQKDGWGDWAAGTRRRAGQQRKRRILEQDEGALRKHRPKHSPWFLRWFTSSARPAWHRGPSRRLLGEDLAC